MRFPVAASAKQVANTLGFQAKVAENPRDEQAESPEGPRQGQPLEVVFPRANSRCPAASAKQVANALGFQAKAAERRRDKRAESREAPDEVNLMRLFFPGAISRSPAAAPKKRSETPWVFRPRLGGSSRRAGREPKRLRALAVTLLFPVAATPAKQAAKRSRASTTAGPKLSGEILSRGSRFFNIFLHRQRPSGEVFLRSLRFFSIFSPPGPAEGPQEKYSCGAYVS